MTTRDWLTPAALATFSLALNAAGCGDDTPSPLSVDERGNAKDGGGSDAVPTELVWDFRGLDPLGDDYVYEGWIIVDDKPVSTGTFDIDADGFPSVASFEATEAQAAGSQAFVLSIEPREDDDPAPSMTKLLHGEFESISAVLRVKGVLGDDFTDAAGTYILNTPSTDSDDDDYAQGIWWLIPPPPGTPSLELPELPEGWVYEGWVVGADGPVTTGRFTDLQAADADGAGPTAGPDDFPPYPGQDYIDPAVDLIGMTAVISVEPEPDNSPGPFTLKPLVDMDIEDLGLGVGQDMTNNAADSNPGGSVWYE